MPDVEYRIVITNNTSFAKDKEPIAGNSGGSVSTNTSKNEDNSTRSVWGYVAYKKVQNVASQIISGEIGLVSVRTGRQEQQAKMQFAYDAVSRGIGLAESIAVGFAAGNVAGAVAGAALNIGSSLIGYFINAEKLRAQENLENISLGLLRGRTGGLGIYTDNSR